MQDGDSNQKVLATTILHAECRLLSGNLDMLARSNTMQLTTTRLALWRKAINGIGIDAALLGALANHSGVHTRSRAEGSWSQDGTL